VLCDIVGFKCGGFNDKLMAKTYCELLKNRIKMNKMRRFWS